MDARITKKIIMLLIAMVLIFSGCSLRNAAGTGSPIEPIAPGLEKGDAQTLLGHFAVKSADVQIRDLSVTADGALTVVGTAANVLYLLENDGKLLWERQLNSEPISTYLDPEGRFLAVGTEDGKLLVLKSNQTVVAEHLFDAPVGLLSASADGELLLVGLIPATEDQPSRIVMLENSGRNLRWEKSFGKLIDAKVAGNGDLIFVNWLDGKDPVLTAFAAEGEKIWEVRQRKLFSLNATGSIVISSRGQEVMRYNNSAEEQWVYPANGTVSRVIMTENSTYLGVLVKDEATHTQEFLYLDAEGEKLWSKRLPPDSDVIISQDGKKVIVASWREYRDDATQVFVYNQHGQEVNVLEVAGRAQKMALAHKSGILVMGLEDGSIYFLSVAETATGSIKNTDRGLYSYYQPVSYGRDDGESRLVLFFFDEGGQSLIPVTRRVQKTALVLRASIDELIRGPIQGSNLHRPIPKDVAINVEHNEGEVVIDLPLSLHEMSGSTFLTGVLDSLLLTVSQFERVHQISFTVNGQEIDAFGQEGIVIDEPFIPQRFGQKIGERLIFLPTRSGQRFYLRTESKALLPLKDRVLVEALTRTVLAESEGFMPRGLELQSVIIENNTVFLDFSDAFNKLIIEGPEGAAQAAMIRDALALTIAENVHYSSIQITVNGKQPRSPEGYLPWDSKVTKPYFINPED